MDEKETLNNAITLKDNVGYLAESISDYLIEIDEKLEELNNIKEDYREKLKCAMEHYNIEKVILNNRIAFTYVPATTSESFDKKVFKKEHPDIYDEYVVVKKKDAYIRATKI